MRPYTIIWDFDGTLFPQEPYDSEQLLLIYRLNQLEGAIPLWKRAAARVYIHVDMKEWLQKGWFRKVFNTFYLWFLKGTPVETLDQVAASLVESISEADRQTLLRLKTKDHRMIVLSCGTADLSTRVLKRAGVDQCFDMIVAKKFAIENGQIVGMNFHFSTPDDKLKFINEQKLYPEKTVVIGDGYTDLPLLDWAGVSIMIDRTGEKSVQYRNKNYYFISSLPEILEIV
jgi:phosphoserine phosphatase